MVSEDFRKPMLQRISFESNIVGETDAGNMMLMSLWIRRWFWLGEISLLLFILYNNYQTIYLITLLNSVLVHFNYITISLYHYISISLYHYISISLSIYIIIFYKGTINVPKYQHRQKYFVCCLGGCPTIKKILTSVYTLLLLTEAKPRFLLLS